MGCTNTNRRISFISYSHKGVTKGVIALFIAMECKSSQHKECLTIPCDCHCHKLKTVYEKLIN